jgi:hypothetical protein
MGERTAVYPLSPVTHHFAETLSSRVQEASETQIGLKKEKDDNVMVLQIWVSWTIYKEGYSSVWEKPIMDFMHPS